MNIISLIKKDYLLLKRYLLLMILFLGGIPMLVLWKAPDALAHGGLMMTAFMAFVLCEQQLSVSDVKYPKALTLLFATPYKRSEYVIARYAILQIIFVLTLIIYDVVCLVAKTDCPSVANIISTFLFWSVFLGVYLPLQFKLGFEKMKYAMMVIIMFPPIVLPLLLPYIKSVAPNISVAEKLSGAVANFVMLALAVLVQGVSAMMSVHILNNKEI